MHLIVSSPVRITNAKFNIVQVHTLQLSILALWILNLCMNGRNCAMNPGRHRPK